MRIGIVKRSFHCKNEHITHTHSLELMNDSAKNKSPIACKDNTGSERRKETKKKKKHQEGGPERSTIGLFERDWSSICLIPVPAKNLTTIGATFYFFFFFSG